MDGTTLGKRVRELRRKAGITQLDLACRVNISESYIALIEADKRNPGMDIISTLANEFHVSVDYLVSGKTSEDDNLRVREWSSLIRERSQKDIESALKLVRVFFECMDSKK
ncbi:helix-turn-helix transcriptional regulator [bacterium]|nr:helix-turn-helix transcriptional regulator [bacterium]